MNERDVRNRSSATPRITANLWFDTESMEAAEFYVSVFPNSEILGDPDVGRGQRAMQAMLGMRKLDLAALRAAADEV